MLLNACTICSLVVESPLQVSVAFLVCAIVWMFKRLSRVDDDSMDAATLAYLVAESSVPDGQCKAAVGALESAPFTEDESECAEQMRAIIRASHIPYSAMIESPETLLRCSTGHGTS